MPSGRQEHEGGQRQRKMHGSSKGEPNLGQHEFTITERQKVGVTSPHFVPKGRGAPPPDLQVVQCNKEKSSAGKFLSSFLGFSHAQSESGDGDQCETTEQQASWVRIEKRKWLDNRS